ncbi:MAG: PIG-L family deacetylase [Sulfolobaceae archaeon]
MDFFNFITLLNEYKFINFIVYILETVATPVRINTVKGKYSKMRVLIIAPHPDDETLCCGGSIVKFLEEGNEVRVIIVTDGRYGSPNDELRGSKELIEIRKKEALNATRILGLSKDNVEFLDFEDGKIKEKRNEVKAIMMDILENYGPDFIFAPIPLDKHSDHSELGKILLSLFPSAYFYIIWTREDLDLSEWNEIRTDIRRYKEKKIMALNEYKSQIGGFPDDLIKRASSDYEIFYRYKF